MIHRGLHIPGGAGFLPRTVVSKNPGLYIRVVVRLPYHLPSPELFPSKNGTKHLFRGERVVLGGSTKTRCDYIANPNNPISRAKHSTVKQICIVSSFRLFRSLPFVKLTNLCLPPHFKQDDA